MPAVRIHDGLNIEYALDGPAGAPVVLLVMGLGMQLIAWPPHFVEPLVAAGWRVLRFDNRDCGLSTHLDHLRVPSLSVAGMRYAVGLRVNAPYSLDDMALDTVRLLDALDIDRAHLVGVSMGGMIAQLIAARNPERTRSLTSIMSTSGARRLPGPDWRVRRALMSRPSDPRDRDAIILHQTRVLALVGSPDFPIDDATLRAGVARSIDRAYNPPGVARQMLAVLASGDRSPLLRRITAPTLVLHGERDPLVPIAGGRDTAAKIRGARFVAIPGMGHDLPPAAVDRMMKELLGFLAQAEPQPAAAVGHGFAASEILRRDARTTDQGGEG